MVDSQLQKLRQQFRPSRKELTKRTEAGQLSDRLIGRIMRGNAASITNNEDSMNINK